jgi:hypothetical protein
MAGIGGVPGDVCAHDTLTVARSAIEGDGLFATDDVPAGTILIRLTGHLLSSTEPAEILAASDAGTGSPCVDTITVDDDRHLVLPPSSIVHFGNHSWAPTMWHVGPYEVAARRHIRAGEDLTVDYGTNSTATGFSMTCRCGSSPCRSEVSPLSHPLGSASDTDHQ